MYSERKLRYNLVSMGWRILRNERGYSLMEVMVAASLSAAVILGVAGMVSNFNLQMRDTTQRSVLNYLRTMVIQEMNKPASWIKTYVTNGSFECVLLNDSPCPDPAKPDASGTLGGTIFKLYRATTSTSNSNLIVVDFAGIPDGLRAGFTLDGKPCTTAVTEACPIRLLLQWSLVSQGGGVMPGGYYSGATTYFPTGYYTSGYFSSLGLTSGYYGFIGNNPGQVNVTGTFTVFTGVTSKGPRVFKSKTDDLNFSLIKEVP